MCVNPRTRAKMAAYVNLKMTATIASVNQVTKGKTAIKVCVCMFIFKSTNNLLCSACSIVPVNKKKTNYGLYAIKKLFHGHFETTVSSSGQKMPFNDYARQFISFK